MSDDLMRLLSRRDGRALPPLGAGGDGGKGGSPAILGRVTTTSAAPGTFFSLQPQTVTGGECEGCDGTLTDRPTVSILAYNLGPATLASGDKVVARFVGSRWVAGRKAGGGELPGGCGCFAEEDIPPTLDWTYVGKRWDDFSGSPITLGTTSGTLAYTEDVTFGGCGLGGAGWIGEFEFYTEGVPPDTGISSLLLPHCSTLRPGGTAGTLRCLWLALMCTPGTTTAGTGAPATADLFWAVTLDGDPACYLYNAGIESLDGFAGGRVVSGSWSAGPESGWISFLCADGAFTVSFDVGHSTYSTLTISL